jgi:LPXTG-motif cell wall-anchored protein
VTLVLFFRDDVPHARRPKLQFPFLIIGATVKKLIFISGLMLVFVCSSAKAITVNDTFAPPSPLWSNSSGNWTANGGTYFAQTPSNSPETYSGLPFDFTNSNFALTVTINNLRDEGIWLNTDGSRNNGVLFVGGGNAQHGDWAYWAVFQNGSFSNCCLSLNTNAFTPDLTYTITILINGNTYQAYMDPDGVYNANSVLLTTLVDNTFSHGMVGLYQFSGGATSFSNLSITGEISTVPGPVVGAGIPGLLLALGGLIALRRRNFALRQWRV